MCTRITAVAWVVVFASLAGCKEPGQRLLKARVELDGQPLMHATYSVPDSETAASAWKQLEGMVFNADRELKPDTGKPGQTTLYGKVRVVLDHASIPFAAVDLDRLQLNGDPATPTAWRLGPGEVERTLKLLK